MAPVKIWGNGCHAPEEQVIVAGLETGEQYVVTAGEWELLSPAERTSATFTWILQASPPPPSKEERFAGQVTDDRILAAIEMAWQLLLGTDRSVLDLLGIEFETASLPDRKGQATSRLMAVRHVGYGRPRILLDPDKLETADERVFVALHEMIHVAYRHGDILMTLPPEHQAAAERLLEIHASTLARALMQPAGEPDPEP